MCLAAGSPIRSAVDHTLAWETDDEGRLVSVESPTDFRKECKSFRVCMALGARAITARTLDLNSSPEPPTDERESRDLRGFCVLGLGGANNQGLAIGTVFCRAGFCRLVAARLAAPGPAARFVPRALRFLHQSPALYPPGPDLNCAVVFNSKFRVANVRSHPT